MEGAGLTRRSSRERVQTPKALEWNQGRARAVSSDREDTIEVIEEAPTAPRSKRTEMSSHPKECVVATKVKALTAKAGERPATMAATLKHSGHEKAVSTANTQIKVLTDMIKSLLEAMEGQTSAVEELKQGHANQIEVLTRTFTQQIETLKAQVTEMAEKIETQLSNIQPSPSASPSYAEIARTPPSSRPSNIQTLTSVGTTPSTMTDILYCTIDTSRVQEEERSKAQPGSIRKAIEEEIRTMEGQEHWRCTAVMKDARNHDRIRVTCRNETELQRVKKAAEKTAAMGARVLRDQLYPVKVDNANRTAILDQDGKVLPGTAEVLGKENDVHIAKIAWLSRKDAGKVYGSMVVYVTKGSEAMRLLKGQYFHVAGESAYTRAFEPRYGPLQCYRCQELGHKAFSCTKVQICARCAQSGHHHSECQAAILKCVPCGGPHESFSKNCRVLYPAHHE
jgi:hypothetical protein